MCYLLVVMCSLLCVMFYWLSVMCYLVFVLCYLLYVMCYLLLVIYYLLFVKCAGKDMHEKIRLFACNTDPLRPPSTVFRGTKGSRVSVRGVPRPVSYPLVAQSITYNTTITHNINARYYVRPHSTKQLANNMKKVDYLHAIQIPSVPHILYSEGRKEAA